jgi:hypothetical protein
MSWVVVKGVYREGKIEPLEDISYRQGSEVLVLFPEIVARPPGQNIWQKIKQRIDQQSPELLTMTRAERQQDFDALSQKIADQMPYRSVADFERAMRGDQYDLAGH